VGLIAANDDDYTKTNRKAVPARQGVAELQVDVVDSGTKEIGGTFRMLQVRHREQSLQKENQHQPPWPKWQKHLLLHV
jgi:hypothetical protein